MAAGVTTRPFDVSDLVALLIESEPIRAPVVALLDQSDVHHLASVAALKTLRDPLVTVWPAFTEAMYLLGPSWPGQKALCSRVEAGALTLAPLDEGEAPRLRELM